MRRWWFGWQISVLVLGGCVSDDEREPGSRTTLGTVKLEDEPKPASPPSSTRPSPATPIASSPGTADTLSAPGSARPPSKRLPAEPGVSAAQRAVRGAARTATSARGKSAPASSRTSAPVGALEVAPAPTARTSAPVGALEAAPAPIAPSQGPVASGPGFRAWLSTTGAYAVGSTGHVRAVVVPTPPYKCNDKYPSKFTLGAPPAGVTYPATVVKGMRVESKRCELSVPFRAVAAGKGRIAGTLAFSVCTKERCVVEKRALSVVAEAR